MTARKLLVFTDLHLTRAGRAIIGLDPAERFATGLAHALATHPDADRLIITGDLAHTGHPEEYARLRAALAELPIPLTLMLGNHDRREAFRDAFPEAPLTASGHVQSAVRLGDDTLLCLDTLDGPPYRDGHHSGILGPDRLAWLESELARAPGRVLVFTHHPPYAVGFPGMDEIRLADDAGFLAVLRRRGNVAHVFSGHVHRTVSGNVGGLAVSMFKSPCHQMPMLLGAAGSGHSVPEPGAYGIVLLSEGSVVVHTEDFDLAARP